jgi:hypothetical protein
MGVWGRWLPGLAGKIIECNIRCRRVFTSNAKGFMVTILEVLDMGIIERQLYLLKKLREIDAASYKKNEASYKKRGSGHMEDNKTIQTQQQEDTRPKPDINNKEDMEAWLNREG